MPTNDGGLVLGPGEGHIISVPGHKVAIKISGEDTDGAYTLMEVELNGDGPPQHIHKNEDEAFYVLKGEIQVHLEDRTVIAKAGAFVRIPRGMRHAFARVDEKNARLLAMFTPAGFEKFFDDAVDLDVTDTEAYVAKGKALAEKYHMEILGPPLDA